VAGSYGGNLDVASERLHAIKLTASLSDALEMMGREDVNQLP